MQRVGLGKHVWQWQCLFNHIGNVALVLRSPSAFVSNLDFTPAQGFLVVGLGGSLLGEWDETHRVPQSQSPSLQLCLLQPTNTDVVPISHYVTNSQACQCTSIAASPDGQFVAAGFTTGVVTVWNISNQQPIAILSDHTTAIQSIHFHFYEPLLAVNSKDDQVTVYHLF